ncbi:hypothetical protein D9M68_635560 [compost metagenome]
MLRRQALQEDVGAHVAVGDGEAEHGHGQQREDELFAGGEGQQPGATGQGAGHDAVHQSRQGIAVGEERGAQQRAQPGRAPEPAEGARVTGEDVLGEYRQQHRVAGGGEVDHQHAGHHQADRRAAGDVAQAFAEHIAGGALGPWRGGHADHQQAGGQAQVGQGVEGEAGSLVGEAQQQAGQRRADEARAVEQHGVQRQGVGQVFLAADELAEQGLAQGRIEGVEHAEQGGHGDDQRRADQTGGGEQGQADGLQTEQPLDANQQAALVVAIDPGAGQRAHQQLRQQRGEGGDAQQRRRAGEAIDQPGQGDLLQPTAQGGDGLAGEVEAEVAVAQGADGGGPGAGFGHRDGYGQGGEIILIY